MVAGAGWPTGAGVALCGSRATLTAALGPGKAGSTSSLGGVFLCGQQEKGEQGHSDETAAPMSVWGPSTQGRTGGGKATMYSGLPGSH